MKCFHLTLQITKSCCRAVPDDKFEVQNDPTCTNIGFSIKTEYGEKGQRNFHAVTWPSISREAGQATAQENHQCQSKVRFHAVGQEK